jgi:hypothetical protein
MLKPHIWIRPAAVEATVGDAVQRVLCFNFLADCDIPSSGFWLAIVGGLSNAKKSS